MKTLNIPLEDVNYELLERAKTQLGLEEGENLSWQTFLLKLAMRYNFNKRK